MLSRKTILAIPFGLLFTASSYALPFVDIEISADVFQAETKINDKKQKGDDSLFGGHAKVEHAIPLLPNVRGDMRKFSESGVDINRADLTLYYQVLDNKLVSLDLGAGATRFELKDGDDGNEHSPHLYMAAEAGLPFVNWSVFADSRYLKYNDNEGVDVSLGLKWKKESLSSLFGYGMSAGYRVQDHTFEGIQGADIDVKNSGFFAALDISF